ncbi:hypothetical protein ACPOL_3380 [Acidisarcina polymorpha]|uniref:Uncharacterized protein n=1 Tax=Acidisarcina polymorpha TaxID=2211140 RepID=A0A2Z5G0U8_9BACT|nr:hypothetical protein ACPOL_3380 [Acidisarcina polymorpha]
MPIEQKRVDVGLVNDGAQFIDCDLAVRDDEQVYIRPLAGIRQVTTRTENPDFVDPWGLAELQNMRIQIHGYWST